jgi:hypothetical protein
MLDKANPPFKKQSGVSKRDYREYKFDSHKWFGAGAANEDATAQMIALFKDLTNHIVLIDGTYWLRDPVSGLWSSSKSEKLAMRDAKNKFLDTRFPCGEVLTNELLNSYFTGVLKKMVSGFDGQDYEVVLQVGSVPTVNGTISIPFAPNFIDYKNTSFLNTWSDTSVVGDEAYAKEGLGILRMLYRSLCDCPELDPDPVRESEMLLEQIRTNTYTDETFRFVLHWFAAVYQRPGINLLTNIWFVSTLEGIGKSLFVNINARTIGYNNFFRMQPAEIERGWNDCLIGKQLVEFDEFPRTRKFDWPSWIKRTTIAPELMVSKRGTTQTNIINVGNYVFSLNPRKDGDIIEMGSSDRRNVFIKGTDDEKWKAYSTGIATRFAQDWEPFAVGWAWVLEQVKLDLKLVNSNHATALKTEMLEDAASEDIIMSWLKNDATLAHNVRYPAAEFWHKYADWVKIYDPSHHGHNLLSLNKFCTKAKKYPGVNNIKPSNKSYYVIEPVAIVDRVAAIAAGEADIRAIFADGIESEAIVVEPIIIEPSRMDQMREHLRRETVEVDVEQVREASPQQGPNLPNSVEPELAERMKKNTELRRLAKTRFDE